MAKIKLLVDTDIIIDYLNGVKPARDLFRSGDLDIYCSVLSKKELLKKYYFLIDKYGERQESIVDYIIAATAWAKNLPLLTC